MASFTSTTDSLPDPTLPRADTYDRRVILRYTKKLADVIGPEKLATREPDGNDWYANLLVLDRRKCLLLTHVDTLFTIFEPDVRTPALRSTHRLVTELIERELLAEALPPDTFGELGTDELVIAKTANRSVLGCMNDMALVCELAVADAGGLRHLDVASLNHRLHRHINSARGYEQPIDLVIARITK